MSKIRNSLGVIVLPTPNDTMSFESYKETYGINPHSLIDTRPDYSMELKPVISKMIVLDMRGFYEKYGGRNLNILPVIGYDTDSSDSGDYTEYYFRLHAGDIGYLQLTRRVYADGITPDEWTIDVGEI